MFFSDQMSTRRLSKLYKIQRVRINLSVSPVQANKQNLPILDTVNNGACV